MCCVAYTLQAAAAILLSLLRPADSDADAAWRETCPFPLLTFSHPAI